MKVFFLLCIQVHKEHFKHIHSHLSFPKLMNTRRTVTRLSPYLLRKRPRNNNIEKENIKEQVAEMNSELEQQGSMAPTQEEKEEQLALKQNIALIAEVVKQMSFTQPTTVKADPPYKFSGNLVEDPRVFIIRMEEYLKYKQLDVPEAIDDAVMPYLVGEAADWYEKYQGTFLTVKEFTTRFRNEFLSFKKKAELRTCVFTAQQSNDELPAAFVGRQRRLCLRYDPKWPEQDLVNHLIDQLRREYRTNITHSNPQTVSELLEACDKWTYLLRRRDTKDAQSPPTKAKKVETKSYEAYKKTDSTKKDVKREPRTPTCWICEGTHFNRDCPNRDASKKDDDKKQRDGTISMINDEYMSVPTINVIVKHREIEAMIDTAASHNLARSKWISGPIQTTTPTQFTLALKDETTSIDKKGIVHARIGDDDFEFEASVTDDLVTEIILGIPWLQENDAKIDIEQRCMYVRVAGQLRRINFAKEVSTSQVEKQKIPKETDTPRTADKKKETPKETDTPRTVDEEIKKLPEKNVSRREKHPTSLQVKLIKRIDRPKTRKEVRKLIEKINEIKDYIEQCSLILDPLINLLDSNERFDWTEECEHAFQRMKTAVSRPLTLYEPDPLCTFQLRVDNGEMGASATLFQEADGVQRPVSYASLRFNRTEGHYLGYEQGCTAIMWALKRYALYLENRAFILITNNQILDWLHEQTGSKYKKWSRELKKYTFKIRHVDEDVVDTTPPTMCVINNKPLALQVKRNAQRKYYYHKPRYRKPKRSIPDQVSDEVSAASEETGTSTISSNSVQCAETTFCEVRGVRRTF